MRHKGFTLVEILIVVVILGILAAIVVPQFTEASNDAKESALSSDLQTVRSQLELYKIQHNGGYPTTMSLLTSKTTIAGVVSATGAYGPYLQKIPTNPFVDLSTIDTTTKGGGNAGWYYAAGTGEFTPDDDDHSSW